MNRVAAWIAPSTFLLLLAGPALAQDTPPTGEMSQKERIALCRDRAVNGNPNAVPQEEALRISGPVTRPQIISQAKPEYTIEARKARIQGTVICEVLIDREGCIQEARVLKGLPMGLDQAALDAIKQWVFEPARMDGKPVPVFYVLTTNFQLMDADGGR